MIREDVKFIGTGVAVGIFFTSKKVLIPSFFRQKSLGPSFFFVEKVFAPSFSFVKEVLAPSFSPVQNPLFSSICYCFLPLSLQKFLPLHFFVGKILAPTFFFGRGGGAFAYLFFSAKKSLPHRFFWRKTPCLLIVTATPCSNKFCVVLNYKGRE